MGVGGQRHAPAALPPGKTQYPLYRRLLGPQGRSGEVRKISPSPVFDPRTVQPVASRYTDWAIAARTDGLPPPKKLGATVRNLVGWATWPRICATLLYFYSVIVLSVCFLLSLYSIGPTHSIRDEAAATNMGTWEVATGGWPKLCNERSPRFLFFFCGATAPLGPRPPHCWDF